MSPRRFDRRTYMIVAPGWSALAFNAAMSASSASTTIRSAFPFTLKSDSELPRHFWPSSKLYYERALTRIERYLACELLISFMRGGCRVAHSARTPICTKIEWGGRWFRGITCYMVHPMRASYIGISQQWRASLRDGNSVTPAQVTSIKVIQYSCSTSLSGMDNSNTA